MSIAVSAVVRPSRRLRAMVAAYGLVNLAAAFAVGLLSSDRFVFAGLSGICFLTAGACLLHHCASPVKTHRIDISGVGRLLLTVQQDIGEEAENQMPASERGGFPAELLAGSTRWPQLILLRLRTEEGAVTLLPVLRDSVAPGVFRALAVALTTIGGRKKPVHE
jgi:toxin CptA